MDISYRWRGFALSFIVVFLFVILQNLGVNLSWSSFFKGKPQAQTAQQLNVGDTIDDKPVTKTSVSR